MSLPTFGGGARAAFHQVNFRHGVSWIRSGRRLTLDAIFPDAPEPRAAMPLADRRGLRQVSATSFSDRGRPRV